MSQTQVNTETKQVVYWKAGMISSLMGGLVFGMMMAMMGSLPMIAGMVGSQSPVVGFIVHMMISAIFGILFALFARFVKLNAVVVGIVYGGILWFIFPFIMMPMMMGQMAFQFTAVSMMSLLGHIIYGLVTGVSYKITTK